MGGFWLTMEFFINFYEVIEESRVNGRTLESFYSTFIALVPKDVNPCSFKYFRPISLCYCIYKICVKIVAKRIKHLLFINILGEICFF
jgi:hypothetical protein